MLLEKSKQFYWTVGIVCVQPSVCTSQWLSKRVNNIKIKAMWADFGVSLSQVQNELEKIWGLGCLTVTSGPHFPCKSCSRFLWAKLPDRVPAGHFYASFIYHLMSIPFEIQMEQPVHLFNNISYFVQFVIHRMVTWYLHWLITYTKIITNFCEPSQSEYFPRLELFIYGSAENTWCNCQDGLIERITDVPK